MLRSSWSRTRTRRWNIFVTRKDTMPVVGNASKLFCRRPRALGGRCSIRFLVSDRKSQQKSWLQHFMDREIIHHLRRQVFPVGGRAQLFDRSFQGFGGAYGDWPSLHDVVIARDGVSFRQKRIFVGAYIDSRDLVPIFILYLGEGAKKNLTSPASSPSAQSP
jgi:hypothetical protein